ncbi:hypothetical protein [Pseudemcibacter aquimaris]|uniref:hypothetical protein n=1 Tax=Pseudemcibacter aquimaris TaxID=2857064 RepID=UPI0020114536|nr:hypothetical protein [Pseudemcibacter aquimaris]MCC3861588.1 hypothetical protein [Pseudemcibacter aquimaris]WDU58357.1 hypothetical protein KW060_14285 [Pseudemcibacter aquimaris]
MSTSDVTCLDNNRYGILHGAKRIWAIGAIHGQLEPLEKVHKTLISKFRRGDKLVYLGNYFGLSDQNKETYDEILFARRKIMSLPEVFMPEDFIYLRGAREEMFFKLLQLHYAPNPVEVMDWLLSHGIEYSLKAYGEDETAARSIVRQGTVALTKWTNGIRRKIQGCPGHVELTNSLKRACMTDDGRLLFVHASIDPSRPLAMQKDQFWWDNGQFDGLTARFSDFAKVIRGYDHANGGVKLDGEFTATIDAGCGRGGELVAICFSVDGEKLDEIRSE